MPDEVEVKDETPAPLTPTFAEAAKAWEGSRDGKKFDVTAAYKAPAPASEKKEDKADDKADKKADEAPAKEGEEGEEPDKKVDTEGDKAKAEKISRRERIERRIRSEYDRKLENQRRDFEGKLAALTPKQEKEAVEEKPPVEPQRSAFESTDDYIVAIRKYDKDLAAFEKKQSDVTQRTHTATTEEKRVLEKWAERRDVLKKTDEYKNWDEVAAKAKDLQFTDQLMHIALRSDPSLMYDCCRSPRLTDRLNELTPESVAAITTADDTTLVLRYLGKNPEDIGKLNNFSVAKKAAFVGKLEARAEIAGATQSKEPKGTDDAKAEKKSGSASDSAAKGDKPRSEPAEQGKAPAKPKADVAPKMTGGSPTANNWTAPTEMSFAEREALMKESLHKKPRRN